MCKRGLRIYIPINVLFIDMCWIFSGNARTVGAQMEERVSRRPRRRRPSGRFVAMRGQHAKVTTEQKEDFRRMKTV